SRSAARSRDQSPSRAQSWICWCITVAAGSPSGHHAPTAKAASAWPITSRAASAAFRSGPKSRRALLVVRRSRRYIGAAWLVLALLPAAAGAESGITTQAVADNGAFLPYAPPPAQLAGLCLVDTGVNLNRDTEGVVIERTALDGGSGGDLSPTLHGTVLAMMAGAPANGWGMVGTAPRAVQIVSVRILEPGHTTFPFSAYATG